MISSNLYLNFDGNCEEAFNFYASVFGVSFNHISRFGDTPDADGGEVSEADKDKIMHVAMNIGTSMLMGSDCGQEWSPNFKQGNNFSISINAESKEQADEIFGALAAGGQVTMPMDKTFWGDYFGMLTDRFGINWMMSFNEKMLH